MDWKDPSLPTTYEELKEIARRQFNQIPGIDQIDTVLDAVKGLVVNDDATNQTAVNAGLAAKALLNKLTDGKKGLKEYNEAKDYISTVDNLVRPWTKKLEEIVSLTRKLIGDYEKVRERERLEADRKRQEAIDQANVELKEKFGTDAPQIPATVPTDPKVIHRSEHGSLYKTRKKRVRVLDITKVPYEYLLVETDMVLASYNQTGIQVPGTEVYEEEIISMRTR